MNCYTVSDNKMYEICSDPNRDQKTICVVEDIRVMMLMKTLINFSSISCFRWINITNGWDRTVSDLKVEELVQKMEIFKKLFLYLVLLWKETLPTSTYLED